MALKQPDDLKAVYNQVYDNIVTVPTHALMSAIPTTTSFIQDLVHIGIFCRLKATRWSFNNNGVQFRTAQQATQYNDNAIILNLVAKQQDLLKAQQTIQPLMQ